MTSVSGYIFTDVLNSVLEALYVFSRWSFSLFLLFTGQVIFLYVSLLYIPSLFLVSLLYMPMKQALFPYRQAQFFNHTYIMFNNLPTLCFVPSFYLRTKPNLLLLVIVG